MTTRASDGDEYVEIVRYVRDLGEDNEADIASKRLLRALRPEGGTTLAGIVSADTLAPAVLVAPSGTGKTTELRQQAGRLRSSGKQAAFVTALGLLASPEMDLYPEERAAFTSLLDSPTPGVLFVDALDELHLRQHTFEELFRRLEREVNFDAHPTRLVFSARNGAWTPSATRELRRLLGRLGAEEPKLIAFEPLDLTAITALASAFGVSDAAGFAAEFEDEEIDELLELRPSDVKLLAQLQRRAGRFSRWTELVQQYIDASFVDERSDRSRGQRLSTDLGRRGLERAAAAALLMKTPHLSTSTVALVEGAISSRRLFGDWSASELAEFFENPLFVHKGRDAEAVQLPQGPLSHFLAARWFAQRVRQGLPSESVRAAVLVKVVGDTRFEIPQAHRKVVGWLASEVPEFRTLIATDHPETVLYEGDPDRLSDAEIRDALRRLCERVASGQWDGWATPATVRRLARASLESEVGALIERHADAPKVLMQLLKLVEYGKYRSCGDPILKLAGEASDALVRSLAIAAFNAAVPEKRSELVNLTKDTDDYVRLALLRALVPDLLHGDEFVAFATAGGGHPLRQGLAEVAHKIATADLDATIRALARVLSSATVSASTGSAFAVAVPVLQARLERGGTIEPSLVEALIAVERLRHDHSSMNLSDREEKALTSLLARNEDVRRDLWRRRFAEVSQSVQAFTHIMNPHFGDVRREDLEWLWGLIPEQSARNRSDARFLLQRLWSRLGVADRARVLGSTVSPDLVTYLQSLSAGEQGLEETRKAYNEAERKKDEETRKSNEEALAKRRADIESGDDLDALLWAWDHLEGPGSENARLSPERLRRLVGEEYVEVFLRGLRAAWRRMDVPFPQPGEGKPYRYLLGLTGVALAVRAGLDLSTISHDEARRAARLALYELNSFPFWYGELARAHVDEVRLALREALTTEWSYPKENHGILRFTSRSDRAVSEMMRSIVLDLLEAAPPVHPTTVDYAVDAILAGTGEIRRVTVLARREIERDGSQMPDANWLRLWAHVEPEAAAEWLSKKVDAVRDATMPVLLKTAALLEQDLDARFGRVAATRLMSPEALGRWARLLLTFVKPGDDVTHHGVYSPGDRDHARDLRHRCLSRLASNPSIEARSILMEMVSDPTMASVQPVIRRLLEQQHAVAVEAAASTWTEDDVLRVERSDEKLPRTLPELFELVRSHLLHVHGLLANDDFSYRGLFAAKGKAKTKEREIQLWVASCLRQRSRGLYSVVRENVVDDDKEVDISAFAAGVGHIPIEIKPLGTYSPAALEKVILGQLLGQYMQPPERRFGILLLARRDSRSWKLGGKPVGLDRLVTHLQAYADRIGARSGKVIQVAVVDLLASPPPVRARSGGASKGRSASGKKSAAASKVKAGARKTKAGSPKKRPIPKAPATGPTPRGGSA